MGDNNCGQLYRFVPNAARDALTFTSMELQDLVADNNTETNSLTWGAGFGQLTDIKAGPDGAIYLSAFSITGGYPGQIYRIDLPEPGGGLLALGAVLLRLSSRQRRPNQLCSL